MESHILYDHYYLSQKSKDVRDHFNEFNNQDDPLEDIFWEAEDHDEKPKVKKIEEEKILTPPNKYQHYYDDWFWI